MTRRSTIIRGTPERRRLVLLVGMAGLAAGLALAGCGSSGGRNVSVGASSTTAAARSTVAVPSTVPVPSTATLPPTVPVPSTAPARSTAPTLATGPARSSASAGSGTCRATNLRGDQVPLSSGTGKFYLAWSLTNTGSSTCRLPGG
jgi:hypothetical protein